MQTTVETLKDLEEEAARFIANLTGRRDGATLVVLSGDLGAGKTAFVKAVAKALGISSVVTSPTFVLEKLYILPIASGTSFVRLAHIDAYRLAQGVELQALGFDDLMRDPDTLIMLEWPERVADTLPKPATHISIEVLHDNARKITYD